MIELRWRTAEEGENGFTLLDQKYMQGGTTPMVLQYREVFDAGAHDGKIVWATSEWRDVPVEGE